MTQPLIAVTGAAGKTGAATVRALRALDLPVRALVRRHDARSEALARLGAEVVETDLYDAARLAQALSSGTSLAEAASRFAITAATARSQLKAIFAKTGASRQSDLVRLVAGLAR